DNSGLLLGTLQACVGPAAGIELSAFVENLDKMPDLDAIVRGEKVSVPDEVDLQYAVASALVGRAIKSKNNAGSSDTANSTIGNILDFAGTFPQREMGVMLVSDMHRAIGQDLFSVPQFSVWAKSIADVMLYQQ
ncbi:MAG: ATPase, partial [Gammaproteobacteria bacterium]|nr:ATPase [Gammaproteobacteria bacterium]